MKVESQVREYASNVEGERIGMTIDESSLAHIMSVLTDLYSDPEMAVVREYSTNALDAHVDAGQSRPIEITLPSPLSPFFRVRDYGNGLDAQEIREVFSRYGASTKRESNDVVGMLGLGCKSALTYSDQFTLTGIKNGRCVQVLVSRDEDGSGSMTIVEDRPTDAPSGTEIIVPAKRANAFEAKASTFFRYWKPGSVLVNGEKPARIDGLWVADDLLLTREAGESDIVVMGNVPYPMPYDGYRGRDVPRLVAFVGIGDVAFTPSREALQMTKRTRAAIDSIRARLAAEIETSVARQIREAASPADAVRILSEGRAIGFKGNAFYRGRTVPEGSLERSARTRDDAGNIVIPPRPYLFVGSGRYARKGGEGRNHLPILEGQHLFEGIESKELSPTKRAKLDLWFVANLPDATSRAIVGVDAFTPDERYWLAGRPIYQWADVDAFKITRDTDVRLENGRPRGAYDGYIFGHWQTIEAGDIAPDAPLFWTHANRHDAHKFQALNEVIDRGSSVVIALPAGRVGKFCRDFPNAVQLDEEAKARARSWFATLDADDVAAWHVQRNGDATKLKGLDAGRVDDPILAATITKQNRNVRDIFAGIKKFGPWIVIPDSPRTNPFACYPLAGNAYTLDPAHFYIYVNAAYAAEGK